MNIPVSYFTWSTPPLVHGLHALCHQGRNDASSRLEYMDQNLLNCHFLLHHIYSVDNI